MMAATLTGLSRGLKRTPEARDEEPIRDELYSVERLEQYAATLAAEHRVYAGRRRGRRLLPGLERDGRLLVAAYRALADQLLEAVGRQPESLTALLAGRLGKRADLDRAFVVQLTQRLGRKSVLYIRPCGN